MPLQVQCSNASCAKVLRVKDEFAGKVVKCPACQTPLKIPAARAIAPAAKPVVKQAAPARSAAPAVAPAKKAGAAPSAKKTAPASPPPMRAVAKQAPPAKAEGQARPP